MSKSASTSEEKYNCIIESLTPFMPFFTVVEFFSTMGLTMKALPRLKDYIMETYREKVKEANVTDFRGRAKVISTFLIPLLVRSIHSPEIFFDEKKSENGF